MKRSGFATPTRTSQMENTNEIETPEAGWSAWTPSPGSFLLSRLVVLSACTAVAIADKNPTMPGTTASSRPFCQAASSIAASLRFPVWASGMMAAHARSPLEQVAPVFGGLAEAVT